MSMKQGDSKLSFSILMANYNHAGYIEEAINSVQNQTYTNWELIIVDDISSDNSVEIIKPYLKDKRIKFVQHKMNLGYGGTLRTAAANASNDIIGIVDPDDKLHEEALDTMVGAYQKYLEFGLIYSTMWNCDSNLENCEIDPYLGPIIPEKTSIFQPKISHFKTFRKEAYLKTIGFDPNQKKGVDKDIIFKLEEVCRLKYIDKPLYYYRRHPGGISQGQSIFMARVYYYIAKCKTYQRRLKTDLPNYKLKDLYIEYFKLTFHNLTQFVIKFMKHTKIRNLIEKLSNQFTFIDKLIQRSKFLTKILSRI